MIDPTDERINLEEEIAKLLKQKQRKEDNEQTFSENTGTIQTMSPNKSQSPSKFALSRKQTTKNDFGFGEYESMER